jgi:hypothetical protein
MGLGGWDGHLSGRKRKMKKSASEKEVHESIEFSASWPFDPGNAHRCTGQEKSKMYFFFQA